MTNYLKNLDFYSATIGSFFLLVDVNRFILDFIINIDEVIKRLDVYRHYKKYLWLNRLTSEEAMNFMAVYVKNLEKSKDFFCHYFNGIAGERYYNSKTGFMSYFISFEDDARLEIMTRPETEKNANEQRFIGYAHLAFSTGSRDAVIMLTERLRNDGYRITGEPRVTGDGYFESVILDHEGNTIEITI